MTKNAVSEVADTKIGNLTLLDGFIIGSAKLASEALMPRIPFVGRFMAGSTVQGGLIKIAVAAGAQSLVPRNSSMGMYARSALTGVLIDGMEDIVLGVRRQVANRNSNESQTAEAAF